MPITTCIFDAYGTLFDVTAAARAAGEEKGAQGPVVTLSRSLIVPFLQFSPRRGLRRKAFEAWTSRGARGGETDNRAIAAEIATSAAACSTAAAGSASSRAPAKRVALAARALPPNFPEAAPQE